MKKFIVVLSILVTPFVASPVLADDQETNCVQVSQYGGGVGVVCGAKHEPKETGLADINPIVLASASFGMAGYLLAKYKKLQRSEVGL